MTFFLKKRTEDEQQQVDQLMFEGLPSFGERLQAQTKETRILKDLNGESAKVEAAFVREITSQIPSEYIVAPDPSERIPTPMQRHDRLFASIERAKAANPKFGNLPTTIEEFDAEVDRRRRAQLDEAQDVLSQSDGFVPELLGDIWAEATTPEGAVMLGTGLTGAARLGVTMAVEGGLAALDEARTISTQQQVADQLGIDGPNAFQQVGIAGLTGAGFAGILAGGGHALSYGINRARTTGLRRPADAPQLEFGDAVDAAEDALARGEDPAADLPARPQTPQYIETPPNWEPIRNGIFAGESGGDYDALFGFQNRPGGKFSDVKLTQMTVDQAIAFSNPRGAYGQWVKGKVGRVATPMGAYQIVGTTLRKAKKGLGLRGDELMTEELQDQLGIWIYRQQGTGAWEGYKGPRSTRPVPTTGDAPPAGSGSYSTSRGYTGSGQVTAGRDFRIDVDYEVVDASTLTRASGDLQPRDRGRASSDEQVAEIAASLDPARLMPAPEADRGAPIVGPDGTIESGNGRVMAVQRAYDRHPDRADAYRKEIEAAGYDIPEGIAQPVLVGRRRSELTDAQRQDFVRQANFSATARMSATERAAVDARRLDADTVALFDPAQPLTARGNVPFTQRVLNGLPQSERNALVDASGRLNAEGVTRVRQAMFARAFDAPDILARFAEADAGELRGLMDALEGAAPSWAAMRSAVSEGRLRSEMDVTPFLMEAVRTIADARRIATRENKASAQIVEELLADVDLLDGALPPLTAALVRKLYSDGRALAAPKVTAFLDRFAAEAHKVGKTDAALFDDTVGVLEVLKSIDKSAFGDLTETGKARVPDTNAPRASDMPADAIPQNAFAEGALSPEAQEADDLIYSALREVKDARAIQGRLAGMQPTDDLDELYRIAKTAQLEIEDLGKQIAGQVGATFKSAGLKLRSATEEKMTRKSYSSARQVTDISRAGFLVETTEQADQIVQMLAGNGELLDEGWSVTPAGYADRKITFRGKTGLVSEFQIWSPELLKAKETAGHELYQAFRSATDVEAKENLQKQMTQLYADALAREDASFRNAVGATSVPKVLSNVDLNDASSGSTRAVSNTSAASTGVQGPPGSSTASASPRAAENNTAGRPSQSQNADDVIGNTSDQNVDPNAPEIKAEDASVDDARIRALVNDVAGDADLSIPLADGTTFSTRQVLDDLDQDEVLETIIDLCTAKGAA
tara:strand:+ start:27520 stop:31137 length:3618 start_codon:yes stop_codon:yes gene_type:complete